MGIWPTGRAGSKFVISGSVLLAFLLAITSSAAAAPSISSLSPTSGAVGTAVTISGSGFGSSQGSSTVTFNGTPGTPTSWRSGTIKVPVPSGASTGNVAVTVNGAASNGVTFTVSPSITSLSPTSGGIGAVVTITGTNFGATQGSSTVTFNGTRATPTSWSTTSIKAPVPSGASTGNVVVTVAGTASSGVSFTVLPTPSISSLSPTSGTAGTSVTISGSAFGSSQGSSTVTFNGTAGTPTSWGGSTIRVPVPSGATSGNVVVTRGGVPSNGVNFTVAPTPTISNLSPSSAGVGMLVTITGTNFGATQGSSTVKFNGTTATPTSWSATSIKAPVPVGASSGNVVVTVAGIASAGVSFTVLPTPSISSLSPTSGAVGTSVTISGSAFGSSQGGSTVTFNGTAGTPTSWGGSTIRVPVPAGATSGNVVVTRNGVPSNGVNFTVIVPTPTISSLSPTSGPVGTSVTITGTNFGSSQGSSVVTFNGVASASSNWSATSITVPVPAGASTGNVVVTVNGLASNGAAFTVLPTPSITGLSPNTGPVGTPVTISGTNFGGSQGTSTVTFGGAAAATNSWGATQIVATVPAAAATGNVVVTVNGVPSNGSNFTVLPTPSITGLSPASAPVGTLVTISGTNFGSTQGSSSVSFNGVAAGNATWSATSIKVPVPAGASNGNVVVTVNGVASNGVNFTVLPTPSITGLSPGSGPVGALVTITGTNFGGTQGGSTVVFGGAAATAATSWSDTSIQVTVPANATTGNVVVTVNGVASNGSSFTVLPTPGITSIVPPSAPVGATVTINGANFGSSATGNSVTFGGVLATTTAWGPNAIQVPVPAGAATGNVIVTVNGVASTGVDFTVLPVPGIASLSPTSGAAGTPVVITGTNFGATQGTSTVTFGGVAAVPSNWSDASITVPVPATAITGDVVVTVSGVPSAGSSFTVLPTPMVTGLSPASGFVGTAVTITGSNFGPSQGGSTVTFNGVAATAGPWNDTSIHTTVPAGASTGNVVVTVGGVPSAGTSFTLQIPMLSSIAVAPAVTSVVSGSTVAYTATGTYTDGSTQNLTSSASWSSSATSVASIDATGTATSAGAGETTITATSGAISGTAILIVNTATAPASLNTSRYLHSATMLNSGQILVAGGVNCTAPDPCTYLGSAELYDPAGGGFAGTRGMTIARTAPALLLANGKVLIAGGYSCDGSGNCSSLSSAEAYDPSTGSFGNAGNMTVARSGHTMTLLNTGQVLIAGGQTCTSSSPCAALSTAEIYDPQAGTFTPTLNQMTAARSDASAVALSTGKVLIVGGFDGSGYPLAAEVYDPVTGTFSLSGPSLGTGRSNATATLLNNGQVLVAGGSTCAGPDCPSSAAELYDPNANSFSAAGNTLTVGRFGHTATLLTNGQVLVAGGYSSCASLPCTVDASTELFDPTSNAFSSGSPITNGVAGQTGTLLPNGDVLLIGGVNGGVTQAADQWYSPSSLTPPGLSSIEITPSGPVILAGQTQPFTALGTFTDGSTQTLQSVIWNSSNPAVATVANASGSAGTVNATAAGTSTLVAAAGSAGGSTSLTVIGLSSLTISPSSQSLIVGTSLQFTATGTFTDGSTRDLTQSVTWSVNNAPGGGPGAGTISTAGSYTAPGSVPGSPTVNISAALPANPGLPGAAQVTILPPPPVMVSVLPNALTLNVSDTVPFTATVQNAPNQVSWQVNDTPGGSPSLGTISPTGSYAAPATVASPLTVSVTAVSQVDLTAKGSAQVTINPVIVQVSPGSATLSAGGTQPFSALLQNAGSSGVTWQVNGTTGGDPSTGTISTSGLYTAPASIASAGSVTVTAISNLDPNQFASATVNLNPLPITVSISPTSAVVNTGATLPFNATVQNTGNTGVTWQVNGVAGGNPTTGTISTGGLYSAPATLPNPAIVTVTAVSQADNVTAASAQVTLRLAFYVSTAGADTNSGTFSAPWRTIQHAASSATPGSVVYVRGGTYVESVNITVSGTAAVGPVIFQNYPGESPIVDGTGLTPPSGIHGLFNITNQSYVTVQGFEVRNYATSSSSVYPAGIWVTGAGSNIQILNNLVHNITTSSEKNGSAYGIAVYGTSGTVSIDSITIDGNQVYNLKTGQSESVNVDGNVTNFAITNNIIHDNDNIGIDAIGFEGVAASSSVDYARNGVISGNTIYNISAINNAGEGKDYDADGIYVDGGSQILIERNLIHNVDIGIEMASEHSGHVASYVTTRNNVVYSSNSAGITIGGYASSVGGTDHCTIVNNTLYNNDTKNTTSGEFQIQYKATNNIFENNIVYGGAQGLLVNNYTSAGTSPTVMNYNIYFSPLASTAAVFVWSGTTRTGFATYQSATGQDSHSQYVDPQYLSLSTPNLQVQPSSPAVNAGLNLGASIEGPYDLAGNPRVIGVGIDIGAFEQ